MADDFTCILRDEFKRFIEELPYEELRQSTFTEELEVADRLLARSERICREFLFFLRIFESRNCDISEDITAAFLLSLHCLRRRVRVGIENYCHHGLPQANLRAL